ncbi:NADH-cytochrome b5 reductase [Coelomomyces lativittatus]|nr:NADH-cytochrome b5 reductase [Coelomomyces lativittatus]
MMVGDKEYQRSYTPITLSTQLDYFELLVKTYAQGHVSKQLDQLSLGTLVYFKGPKGQFKYTPNTYTVLNMIAGGTGITPMYQLIQTILLTLPHDTTQLHLIYANVSLEDILLKKELDELASTYAHQFKVFYVLNQVCNASLFSFPFFI